MTNKEINQMWAKAETMAENIYIAHLMGIGLEQAKKDQQSLRLLVQMAREYGFIYNGQYDEYLNMKL
jgi:hypothetical protein